jgi:diadenosine tetraphosphate (Ap4A) HIT family hydrolase
VFRPGDADGEHELRRGTSSGEAPRTVGWILVSDKTHMLNYTTLRRHTWEALNFSITLFSKVYAASLVEGVNVI